MEHKIIIGLPAYNEESNLGKLLNKINSLREQLGKMLYIIIVNDGSSDSTENILAEYSREYEHISYINHPQNMGLGTAMNTLLHHVASTYSPQDILVTLDADNTHNPNIIPSMIDKQLERHLDIIIASRFTRGGKEIGLSLARKVYSRGAMLFCKLFFRMDNVWDYSCGYRAYQVGFLQELVKAYGDELVVSRGFECMVEILAKAGKLGAKVGEYPLVLEYNLKEGISKMNVKKTILGYLRLAHEVRPPQSRTGE